MLQALLENAGQSWSSITTGVLFRGVDDEQAALLSPEEQAAREEHRNAARQYFGNGPGFLEITPDQEAFLAEVDTLVLGQNSRAARIAEAEFDAVPFHLAPKCDHCYFNQFCLKWSAQHDDVSLVPHLSAAEKSALLRGGVTTVKELAGLKALPAADAENSSELQTPPANRHKVQTLASTWPVGPRLDELIHRAKHYRRFRGDDIRKLNHIPSKGYGSLPYCAPDHNPNLVRIYVEAHYDYLHDRIYALGARVVAAESGEVARRRSVVRINDGPPDEAGKEEKLLTEWLEELLQAVAQNAAPDDEGELRAPLHLIFWNAMEQKHLLEALGRHSGVLLATPVYDFVTQLAAFDSPIATFLQQEIRELKNYPMLCQNMADVARNLRFDWNAPIELRKIFYAHVFDAWSAGDELVPADDDAANEPQTKTRWYTSRARFNSSLPLEYAYSAWNELPAPGKGHDAFKPYRLATMENLRIFFERRLDALEHIANDFSGNKQTVKTPFALPDLGSFECKAKNLATALQEFVTIERHVELAAWKSSRLPPPERRVLAGDTLIVRYLEEDQDAETREKNWENARREPILRSWREENPGKQLRGALKDQLGWSQEGMVFRLCLECADVDCDLDQMLGLSSFREGAGVLLTPRWATDSRLPPEEQKPFTPTPKQMLYSLRGKIVGMPVERDESGRAKQAYVEIELSGSRGGGKNGPFGFVFSTMPDNNVPLVADKVYTIDPDPTDWYGLFCATVVGELMDGGEEGPCTHELYNRFCNPEAAKANWPLAAQKAQQKFLEGLDELGKKDKAYIFEPGKREYIGSHGDTPLLLVQGPPGTGKSYASAFALWARMQGAIAAGLEWRVFLGCKTHAATDVLLENVAHVKQRLAEIQAQHPALFKKYFDARLLEIPLYRAAKTESKIESVIPLPKRGEQEKGDILAARQIGEQDWCFVGTTPGGVYRVLKDAGELFCHALCGCLVLDEASQMNLPEAIMASLALCPEGQVIVVGDHRQMPPIIKHNWPVEPRRTFSEFKSYASLFEALRELKTPMIQFQESFRLHRDMADFLHQEIYQHDGIHYHSRREKTLDELGCDDDFVKAVLSKSHPIVVVVHEERGSLLKNPFESMLLQPVLEALGGQDGLHLDAAEGLGVVVPHRAQRALLQERVSLLKVIDPETGEVISSAVDTVERFQGSERDAIIVSATESDPEYLLVSGDFLLDPRRLTVALSRAKKKMILVASRSVFEVFSSDEEVFDNSQIWKNLLRRTCTVPLWQGDREGYPVEVWGNTHM
jgi:hypothetical protein